MGDREINEQEIRRQTERRKFDLTKNPTVQVFHQRSYAYLLFIFICVLVIIGQRPMLERVFLSPFLSRSSFILLEEEKNC